MTLSDYLKKHGITQKAFGERLGVSQGTVGFWLKGDITAERAIEVEHATNGEVPREHSRPDIDWSVVRPGGSTTSIVVPGTTSNGYVARH